MNSITSSKTIKTLWIIFANHGLPRKVVTDNGTSFTSAEFRSFMSDNGIVYGTTSPYHPSSNRLAEHAMQKFKNSLKATIQERISSHTRNIQVNTSNNDRSGPCTTSSGMQTSLIFFQLSRNMLRNNSPSRQSSMTLPSHYVSSKLVISCMLKISQPPQGRHRLFLSDKAAGHPT